MIGQTGSEHCKCSDDAVMTRKLDSISQFLALTGQEVEQVEEALLGVAFLAGESPVDLRPEGAGYAQRFAQRAMEPGLFTFASALGAGGIRS